MSFFSSIFFFSEKALEGVPFLICTLLKCRHMRNINCEKIWGLFGFFPHLFLNCIVNVYGRAKNLAGNKANFQDDQCTILRH